MTVTLVVLEGNAAAGSSSSSSSQRIQMDMGSGITTTTADSTTANCGSRTKGRCHARREHQKRQRSDLHNVNRNRMNESNGRIPGIVKALRYKIDIRSIRRRRCRCRRSWR